jgi:hypothetical protein
LAEFFCAPHPHVLFLPDNKENAARFQTVKESEIGVGTISQTDTKRNKIVLT